MERPRFLSPNSSHHLVSTNSLTCRLLLPCSIHFESSNCCASTESSATIKVARFVAIIVPPTFNVIISRLSPLHIQGFYELLVVFEVLFQGCYFVFKRKIKVSIPSLALRVSRASISSRAGDRGSHAYRLVFTNEIQAVGPLLPTKENAVYDFMCYIR